MSDTDIFKRACTLVNKSLDVTDTQDMSVQELRREIAKTRLALYDLVKYVYPVRPKNLARKRHTRQTNNNKQQLDRPISDSYNNSKSTNNN